MARTSEGSNEPRFKSRRMWAVKIRKVLSFRALNLRRILGLNIFLGGRGH